MRTDSTSPAVIRAYISVRPIPRHSAASSTVSTSRAGRVMSVVVMPLSSG